MPGDYIDTVSNVAKALPDEGISVVKGIFRVLENAEPQWQLVALRFRGTPYENFEQSLKAKEVCIQKCGAVATAF